MEKEDINKKIYFLYEDECQNSILVENNSKEEYLKELNEFNIELFINKKRKNIKGILYLKKKENILLI